ncbi:MAG: MCP four helix bundle domain-containing protein, partial [Betaproteobacteria bacterium]
MKHLTVKQQLTLAFSALAAIVLLVSLLSMYALRESNAAFVHYVADSSTQEHLAIEIRSAANRRALAVRNLVLVKTPTDRESESRVLEKAQATLHDALDKLKASTLAASDTDDKERALLAALDKVEAAYSPVARNIAALALAGKDDEAIAKMNSECRPLLEALRLATGEYVAYSQAQARLSVVEAEAAFRTQRAVLIGIGVASMALAAFLGFWITRSLLGGLGAEPDALSAAARRVADGDLSPVAGADAAPARSVLASMGAMQRNLVTLIGRVRASSDSIATGSAQIATGNADLSVRTEHQASALQQTAASMQQLTETVRLNAESAQQANQLAGTAADVAVRGGKFVEDVVLTMDDISAASRKIGDIIGVIDGIAFQTNILAL